MALVCALAQAATPTDNSALSVWAGTYVFESTGKPAAGGVTFGVKHLLVFEPTDSGPSARLEQTGIQIDRVLLCDAEASGSELLVRFRSFADGKALNAYGVSEFEKGEVLFSIQRGLSTNKHKLKTTWKALRPDGVAASGHFFVRTK